MRERVKETIERHALFSAGEKVLVGFSTGIDSVCLLHLLRNFTEYNLRLTALYVNHKLRPQENEQEIELLHRYEKDLGIDVRVVELDMPQKLHDKPQSLQLLARNERYHIFENVCKEIGADKIALAHHRDDCAETILYRLIRGTGLNGLAGIPVKRDNLYVRPLLDVSRAEIATYVRENGLKWCEDSSNHQTKYQRNKLRHKLIPLIEAEYNPRFRESLVRLGNLAAKQQEYLQGVLKLLYSEIIVVEPQRRGIRLNSFLELHEYLQIELLRQLLAEFNEHGGAETFSAERLAEKIIAERIEFKQTFVVKDILARYDSEIIWLEKFHQSKYFQNTLSYEVAQPGVTELSLNRQLLITPSELPEELKRIPKSTVYVDADLLQFPLTIRHWQPGDVFKPLGCGHQKLQDFFVNQKIERNRRDEMLLLVNANGHIIWVIGERLGDDFKVSSQTTKTWKLQIEKH